MEPRFIAKFGVVRGTHLGAKRVAQVVYNPISKAIHLAAITFINNSKSSP